MITKLALVLSAVMVSGTANPGQPLTKQRSAPDCVPLAGKPYHPDHVEVLLKVAQQTTTKLDVEIDVYNRGQDSIFVMAEPTRADGLTGPYLHVSEDNPSVLEVNVRLYPSPRHGLTVDHTSVKLVRLTPGSSHAERFSLSLPVEETIPPYRINPLPKPIDHGIKFLRASVGVIQADVGVEDLLKRKAAGPYINGLELLMSGTFKCKRVIDLQSLILSAPTSIAATEGTYLLDAR